MHVEDGERAWGDGIAHVERTEQQRRRELVLLQLLPGPRQPVPVDASLVHFDLGHRAAASTTPVWGWRDRDTSQRSGTEPCTFLA